MIVTVEPETLAIDPVMRVPNPLPPPEKPPKPLPLAPLPLPPADAPANRAKAERIELADAVVLLVAE